jgi:phospholipase C
MERRDFLKAGLVLGGAAALGGCRLFPIPPSPGARTHSIINGAPGDSGIDTVVICMMENRSFDSYLGWLARDPKYRETGTKRYGNGFTVNGASFQTYVDPIGNSVDTYRRIKYPEADPWRGCNFDDPGHGWNAGRAQRDGGFLAPGSGNDLLALGYFEGEDLPIYNAIARRFLVFDDWHASILGPTYPNREYLLSAQSGGNKANAFPPTADGWQWDSIVDRLVRAGVPTGDYATDFPPLALFGRRNTPVIHTIANYYEDAEAGRLPNVTFVDPKFVGADQSDDHPLGDPRAAQIFVQDVFAAFARSPQWERGLFVLTYDEWGGFFDHVAPPHFKDDRANRVDADDFSQAGFRVPTLFASPRALPGAVDHAPYDHTAVLRFLEWRFLGAPPRGSGVSARWALTQRDRFSRNPGELLSSQYFDPDPYFDLDLPIAKPTDGCVAAADTGLRSAAERRAEPSPWEVGLENGYWEAVGLRHLPVG